MTIGLPARDVLLAEDDLADERALIAAVKEQQLDWRITVARSAAEVHDALARGPFDIALIGSGLPGGITEVVRALTGKAVVLLVDAGGEGAVEAALHAGAIECVGKDPGRAYLAMLPWRVELARQRGAASRTADALRLQAVLDASEVATALNDDQHNITFVNAAFTRTFGYERADIPTLSEWWPKAYPDPTYRQWVVDTWSLRLDQANRPGGVFEPMELRVQRRDGRSVTVLASAAPLTGVATGLHMVLLYDITARKQAEADLYAASRWQHALVTHAGDAIISSDPDGKILTFNPAAERLLGYAAHEVIGKTPALFHDPGQVVERAGLFSRELGEDIEPGFGVFVVKALRQRPNRHDWTYIRKDGSRCQVSLAVTVLTGATGAIEGFMGMASDITARLQAESALRASEARYRAIVEAEPECVKVVSASGELLEMNPAGLAMLEADSLDDVCERGLTAFIVPEHRLDFGALHKRAIGGEPGLLEFEVVGLRGTRRWLETHAAPLPDADGHVDKVLGITRDVTARRQAAAEQAALEAQLVQAHKLESIGRLAGGVAHDFNNMLGVILGHAEMALQELPLDHPVYVDLKEIQNAAQRSAALTRQLLAFARQQSIEPQPLDLNVTITAMLSLLQRLIGENVAIEWRASTSVWPVWMDPSQVDQILTNLCVNARDAIVHDGVGGGTVTITTRNVVVDAAHCRVHPEASPGEFVCVGVRDSGRGMERAIVQHVFEPFFTTKRFGEGTGLGLAMVDGAVRQNHGFISVESVVGEGTTFEIYLPRHSGKPVLDAVAPMTPDVPKGHGTVLVVEDEPAILKLTCSMLGRLGYEVVPAAGSATAIELAAAHPGKIDLLLTDIIMPGMNGSDLAGVVTRHHPDMHVLFMSGYTADVIADHGVVDASVHFMQKPFAARDLQLAVQAAIATRHPVTAP